MRDAGVEQDQDAAIFERADEAAEALLEGEDGGGDLVVEEGLAAGFFDGAHAGLDDGVAGDGEGQAVDDDATERFALHVDALPEAGGAEEDGVGRGAELLEQGFARGGAVEKDGEVEDGQQALVEGAHLRVAGEEAEGAAAGDAEDAPNAVGGGLGKFGIAGVGHVGRQIEQGLLAVAEVRGHDEFAGFSEAEARRMCSKPPCTVSVAEVSTTVGIWSKTSSRSSAETSMGVAWRYVVRQPCWHWSRGTFRAAIRGR